MSVTASELKLYQAATMAASFATASVGGAISATEITGGSIGEVLFTMGSNTAGGGTKTQYEKVFFKNTNGTLPLTSSVVFIKNSLDVVGSNGTVAVVSDSASDDNTKKVTVIGYDASSDPQSEDITMNGTSTATGALTFSKVHRVEFRIVSSGALTTTSGNVTVTRSSALGIIPAGYNSATAEIDIGLIATLDGTSTIADAATAPGGIAFSRPNAQGEGIAVANSQSLTAASGQGIWVRWQLAERAAASADISVVLVLDGLST
jgi:hypothetical protein